MDVVLPEEIVASLVGPPERRDVCEKVGELRRGRFVVYDSRFAYWSCGCYANIEAGAGKQRLTPCPRHLRAVRRASLRNA